MDNYPLLMGIGAMGEDGNSTLRGMIHFQSDVISRHGLQANSRLQWPATFGVKLVCLWQWSTGKPVLTPYRKLAGILNFEERHCGIRLLYCPSYRSWGLVEPPAELIPSPLRVMTDPHGRTTRRRASEQGQAAPDDDENDQDLDLVERSLKASGCLELHYQVQACMVDHKDWRKCREPVQAFRECIQAHQNRTSSDPSTHGPISGATQ
ncbi:hypothetical protein TCAL_03717 [Tigriopus californicus]|uniref:CHCH domain-containing protein n=1 Tax=Tigriopus californicus TaxID=6832 RepID=A0A553N7U6_TIGCA|nr:hypothetical protein TCAL_03717 [Tigriopus californicus]